MSDNMKLIMERFEKFSEKTKQEQTKKLSLNEKKLPKLKIRGSGVTSIYKIADLVRSSLKAGLRTRQWSLKFVGAADRDSASAAADRQKMNRFVSRRVTGAGAIMLRTAMERGYLTARTGANTQDALAIASTNEFIKSFMSQAPVVRGAAQVAVKSFRPYLLGLMRSAISRVIGAQDTPDRLPGDNPEADAKKPISPTDTTQQGGMMGKIARTKRIIKKLGRRIGIRTAFDLNQKLGLTDSEVTADTIKAVMAFQEEYNQSPLGKRRPLTVDGLFGGNTARAFRRFKKQK